MWFFVKASGVYQTPEAFLLRFIKLAAEQIVWLKMQREAICLNSVSSCGIYEIVYDRRLTGWISTTVRRSSCTEKRTSSPAKRKP